MKKLQLSIFFFFILIPLSMHAAEKTVTIDWTMSDTTDVQGYKMYYSYNSSMADKMLACETSNPYATTLTCENINLEKTPSYFVIAALFPDSETTSTAIPETFVTGISIVQGFSLGLSGTNIPPTASISASTISGTVPLTVSFNASGSNDTDGTIASYSWNFGDGSPTATTVNPSHTFSTVGSFQVSLVVTDNKGLASEPTQTSIVTSESSYDATSDFTNTNNWISTTGILIADGAGHGSTSWSRTIAYHNTNIGPNQSASIKAMQGCGGDGSGLAMMINPNTKECYLIFLQNNELQLRYFNGSTVSSVLARGIPASAPDDGIFYEISATISDATITGYFEGVEMFTTVTNTTYATGDYAGAHIWRGGCNSDMQVDDFHATSN